LPEIIFRVYINMSIIGNAQKSNNVKKWTQRFLITSIIQGDIAVSLTIMLAAFVIPPLNSTYSSMTDYNNVDASHW